MMQGNEGQWDIPYSWASDEALAIWDHSKMWGLEASQLAATLLLADRVGLLIDAVERRGR